jgi:superfamily I DNA/RNA helicase
MSTLESMSKNEGHIIAEFLEDLRFPSPEIPLYEDAAEAVKREYRASVKWKRLTCHSVEKIISPSGDILFIVSVGHTLEFDWTWEGAVAFRPVSISDFLKNPTFTEQHIDDPEVTTAIWAGEIVEVDETRGQVFLKVNDPTTPPTRGFFYVKPFEFLAVLNSAYEKPPAQETRRISELNKRLNATRGNIHPRNYPDAQSAEPALAGIWAHAWSILWGPPGTGKTAKIGHQIAGLLNDSDERILVLSTTNKATDEVAVSIGRATKARVDGALKDGRLLRIGKGADYSRFEQSQLLDMLQGTEAELLKRRGELLLTLRKTDNHHERAFLRDQLNLLTRAIKDSASQKFTSSEVQVVVSTSFKALTMLNSIDIRSMIANGTAPFTTVIMDEAGLLSRATTAALSLLASRRILLVGDPKQLAPISRISRVLPRTQATWLASSALQHLAETTGIPSGVNLLRVQHRMHPEVRRTISEYQYNDAILDGANVTSRSDSSPGIFFGTPKTIWYVLDDDAAELYNVRAERGPGNKSWIRTITQTVISKLLISDEVRKRNALIVTPFRAQARLLSDFLLRENVASWTAGTVHSHQGTEADLVIFDTVNAGSCAWPYDEWKRLVNVGLSRARHELIVIASRAEMAEPYLQMLRKTLWPAILKRHGSENVWVEVSAVQTPLAIIDFPANDAALLGSQINKRKQLRPVMSLEQERLCALTLDGKPRLVRGVAGSGKTLVLAHWLKQTVEASKDKPDCRIWAVYANRSLHNLIRSAILDAAGVEAELPWRRIELLHIKDVLGMLLPQAGMKISHDNFEYNDIATEFLQRMPIEKLQPCCDAMFVDEAQDMGPNTLRLLSALVTQSEPGNPKSRAINIFYDNAQNIYRRGTPAWSDMGLDMRGRSTVMKESFRSTRPILECAINVLYALEAPEDDPEHRELVDRGLIEKQTRNGKPWWSVRYNQVDGPAPTLRRFVSLDQEIDALRDQVISWLTNDLIRPNDICIVYLGQNIRWRIEKTLKPALRQADYDLAFVKEQGWDSNPRAVIASTPHSYKGYEAEIVAIAGVEQFYSKNEGIFASALYVAMTRARSVLAMFAYAHQDADGYKARIVKTVKQCLEILTTQSPVESSQSTLDQAEDLLPYIGDEYRDWLKGLCATHSIQVGAIISAAGEIVAEPVFWLTSGNQQYATFGNADVSTNLLDRLDQFQVKLLRPGEVVPDQ